MIFLFLTFCKPSVVNPNNLSSILTNFEKNSFGIERKDKGISGVNEIKEKLDLSKNMLNKSLEIGKTVFNSSNEILKKNKQKHQLFKYNTSRKFSFNQRLESGNQKKNLNNVPSLKIYDADKTNIKSKKDKKYRKKRSKSQDYIESSNQTIISSKLNSYQNPTYTKITDELLQPSAFDKKEASTVPITEKLDGEVINTTTYFEKAASTESITEKNNDNPIKSSVWQENDYSTVSTIEKNIENLARLYTVQEIKIKNNETIQKNMTIIESFVRHVFNTNSSFFNENILTNGNNISNKINENIISTVLLKKTKN